MATKRETPLIIIDRDKNINYPFDYIYVDDNEVPFVAKVVYYFDEIAFTEANFSNLTMIKQKMPRGGLILKIERFCNGYPDNQDGRKRIQTILKKAIKKYISTSERNFKNFN